MHLFLRSADINLTIRIVWKIMKDKNTLENIKRLQEKVAYQHMQQEGEHGRKTTIFMTKDLKSD